MHRHFCLLSSRTPHLESGLVPFSIIASKTFPNGCDVIWSICQWRHWTSIWESEKWPYIWELDADLRIGRRLETERWSESYIYTKLVHIIKIPDEIEIQIMGFKMDPTILLYLKILALCIKNITFNWIY